MVTEELLRYVEFQINRGVDRSSVKMTLLQNGWTGEDVNEAFKVVDTVLSKTITSSPQAAASTETATVTSTADNQPTRDSIDFSGTQTGPNGVANSSTQSNDNIVESTDQNAAVHNNGADNHSNQAQPTKVTQPASTQSQQLNRIVNSSDQVSVAGTASAVNPVRDSGVESLKYRKPQDWQQRVDDETASAFNQSLQQQNNSQLSDLQTDQVNTESQTQLGTVESREPVNNLQAGEVIRPRINENLAARTGFDSVTDIEKSVQQSGAEGKTVASPESINAAGVQSNPAAELRNKKTRSSGKVSKFKVFIIGLVVLLLIGVTTFLFWYTNNSSVTGDGMVGASVENMLAQDYIQYELVGTVPVTASDNVPPAFEGVESGFEISVEGLVDPQSGRNGFGIEADDVVFYYVYDGVANYGKIERLPTSFQALVASAVGNWFDFSSSENTRSLLQLVTNEPATSVLSIGDNIRAGLLDMYVNDFIEIETGDVVEKTIRKGSDEVYSFKGKEVNFVVSSALLASRLGTESQAVTDFVQTTGLESLAGTMYLDIDTELPRLVEFNLVTAEVSYPMTLELFYDYAGKDIAAPPESEIVAASNVIETLRALTADNEAAALQTQVRLVGSAASVYYDENGTYVGLCDSQAVSDVSIGLAESYGLVPVCNEFQGSYVFQVVLPNDEFYSCIDIDYVETTTQTGLTSLASQCGQAVPYQPLQSEVPVGEDLSGSDDSTTTISDEEFFE